MHVRIIGAGWAGLAAAIAACQRGWQVTLIEAAAQAGGRAKRITSPDPRLSLDNGQHVLIGAYRDTLALMRTVGVQTNTQLLRHRLDVRDALDQGLHLPHLPPPLNLLIGIARTSGWTLTDKWQLLRAARAWQRQNFCTDASWSVLQLCDAHALTPAVRKGLIEPLCLSALNTDMVEASASVFLRVLQDGLLSGWGGSDFLIPRQDLSMLFAQPALAWLQQHGATLHMGRHVDADELASMVQDAALSSPIVLATSFRQAAKLTAPIASQWASIAAQLQPRAIATVYLRIHDANFAGLSRPMVALRYDAPTQTLANPEHGPAQFVFCRQQLLGHARVVAAVVSDCRLERDALSAQVAQQLRQQLGLQHLEVLQTVIEKQATFACTAGLQRPPLGITNPLWACGDYVQGPYPATLEGAVRSGLEVITQIGQMHKA